MSEILYLAGRMSGLPSFNFPAFYAATADLRKRGFQIVSPAELDAETNPQIVKEALASVDGKHTNGGVAGHTWGDLLARDVKLIADVVNGIIFLSADWHLSKGAKLEAFVGLLGGKKFYQYNGPESPVTGLDRFDVLTSVYYDVAKQVV